MPHKDLLKRYRKPENFINRDLSWIEFNKRVLDEALNPELPLLDKVKFISIFSSNLDEFYMIRISGIKEQIAANVLEPRIDGLTPREELLQIETKLHRQLKLLYKFWEETIMPDLRKHGIHILAKEEITESVKTVLRNYFKKEIFPILTPLGSDPGRPFPYISNLSLSLGVFLRDKSGENHFARIKAPVTLPRLIPIHNLIKAIPNENCPPLFPEPYQFIWFEDIVRLNLDLLFPKMEILDAYAFRITRDTDIEIQEDEADDLLKMIEENIRQRRFGNVVRIEVEKSMPESMIETIIENLESNRLDVDVIDGPLALSRVIELYDLPLHQLKEKPFYPSIPKVFDEDNNIFNLIKQRPILLHHPYNSFTPVIDFIKQASKDPDVLAIKQTLYRVGTNSPVVKALIEAAERKKQVAVLLELKARFDEENNIYWAKELEKVGVHVVYGLVGLKTHAKMTLVVRKESNELKRYVHLATGNYNASTAKLYTDVGLFTCDDEICTDVTDIFNFLTGYSGQSEFNKLIVAPISLRTKIIELINREAEFAKSGQKGRIIIKINAIVDPSIITALYEASNAGVKIDLIIRGICCLRPGVKGLSDNISVTSIVGRFLEHSRIFYFYNNGEEKVFISSADMMQRNLDGRVEIMIPIEEKTHQNYLVNYVLKTMLKDNTKARTLHSDCIYRVHRKRANEDIVNSQELFMKKN